LIRRLVGLVTSALIRRVLSLRSDRIGPVGVVAGLITAFFLIAVGVAFGGTRFGELFVSRGWVPYVIVLLTAWSGLIVGLRYREFASRRAAVDMDLLPAHPASITRSGAGAFREHLDGLPEPVQDSFLVQRLRRAIAHFESGQTSQEVTDYLATQARSDSEAVETSYAMVRVFLWAIPILGFIGTVIGIGGSVGAFSGAIAATQDIGVIKDSLSAVTTGLGIAFDTTLLALLMSVIVMFPSSYVQKIEDEHLAEVRDYCEDQLMPRLDDERDVTEGQQLRSLLAEEFRGQRETLESWRAHLENIGTTLSDEFVAGWRKIHHLNEQQHSDQVGELRSLSSAVQKEGEALRSDLVLTQQSQVEQFNKWIETLTESADRTLAQQREVHEQYGDNAAALAESAGELRKAQVVLVDQAEDASRRIADQLDAFRAGVEAVAKVGNQQMSGWAERYGEVLDRERQSARREQEETYRKFDGIVKQLAEQTRQASSGMSGALDAYRRMAEQTADAMTRAQDEATEHSRLQSAKIVDAVSEGLRNAADRQLEAVTDAASRQLENISATSRAMAAAFEKTQEVMLRRAAEVTELLRQQQKIGGLQEAVAQGLDSLASTGAFTGLVSDLDARLGQLAKVLNKMDRTYKARRSGQRQPADEGAKHA